jgi:hypothetical protein
VLRLLIALQTVGIPALATLAVSSAPSAITPRDPLTPTPSDRGCKSARADELQTSPARSTDSIASVSVGSMGLSTLPAPGHVSATGPVPVPAAVSVLTSDHCAFGLELGPRRGSSGHRHPGCQPGAGRGSSGHAVRRGGGWPGLRGSVRGPYADRRGHSGRGAGRRTGRPPVRRLAACAGCGASDRLSPLRTVWTVAVRRVLGRRRALGSFRCRPSCQSWRLCPKACSCTSARCLCRRIGAAAGWRCKLLRLLGAGTVLTRLGGSGHL